jgi:hypothetical protein
MPSPDHLAAATDTRGRRLRAALAAGLIRAHAGGDEPAPLAEFRVPRS